MNQIRRKMSSTEAMENLFDGENGFFAKSQASFNSDGCLTIRNYIANDKDNDEIIIFNRQETQAVLNLFKWFKNNDLPF